MIERIIGSVTCQCVRNQPAPSTRAASNTFCGSDRSRARKRITPKPSSRQMITPASERSAQSGLPSQSCTRKFRCSVCSVVLSAPCSVRSSPKSTPTTVTGSM